MSIVPEALRTYLAFGAPGLVAAPLLRRAFPGLRDGGLSVARPLGWVLIAWIAWILPSVTPIPYGYALVYVAAAIVTALGGWVFWQDRAAWRDLFRREWKTIAIGEALALAVFALCVWEIQWNGDIHPLAERFMDYAILRRLGFTKDFPPMDSWMAGKSLQYYYWGYLLVDVLRRLAGMGLRTIFNLALPAIYATFALALYGCGIAIGRRRMAGVAALLGGAFLGNFEFARQVFVRRFLQPPWVWNFRGLDWFRASRVIDGTINEVPAFSMFWGDLHPYLIAFPVVALCICLALASIRAEVPPLDAKRPVLDRWIARVLLALPLGALYPTNSWDFPTFAVVIMAALAVPLAPPFLARLQELRRAIWRRRGAQSPAPTDAPEAATTKPDWTFEASELLRDPLVQACGSVAILSVAFFIPFHIGFGKQVGRGIRLAQRRSDALPMMLHFGPWLAALMGWAIATSKDRATRLRRIAPVPVTAFVLGLFETKGRVFVDGAVKALSSHGGVALALAHGMDHLLLRGLSFVLLVAVLWVLIADLELEQLLTPDGLGRALFAAAIGVVLVCEFAYVDDFYGGENERMNTIFKAYIQAWILLSIGTAGLAMSAWSELRTRGWRWKGPFAAMTSLAVAASLLFPLFADYSRSDRFQRTRSGNDPTWDPQDLFRQEFPADARAVDWIEAHLPPNAVILEASAHAYEWESRICTFTGRIGLIGWQNHESGWRNSWTDALERRDVTDRIYKSDDLASALEEARKYGIQYIYVGQLETNASRHPGYKVDKFQTLERVYSNEAAALYKVPPAGTALPSAGTGTALLPTKS